MQPYIRMLPKYLNDFIVSVYSVTGLHLRMIDVFGRKMVRENHALDSVERGSSPALTPSHMQETLVCLYSSTSIRQYFLTNKNSPCHNLFYIAIGNNLAGSFSHPHPQWTDPKP